VAGEAERLIHSTVLPSKIAFLSRQILQPGRLGRPCGGELNMGRILVFLCLLLVPLANAAADDAEDKYQALLAAAKQGNPPVDWQALRFAYADSPDFDYMGARTASQHQKMLQAFSDGDFGGALAMAKLILDQTYVDIDAHRISSGANRHLGKTVLAEREHAITEGLIKSITTGDGLTPSSAFTVISAREEYELFFSVGLKVTRQTLVRTEGHAYDLMSTVGPPERRKTTIS
jgi:hypothetical protein